jgi:phage tail sheath protein FI
LAKLRARYPGTAGNFSVTITVNLGQNLLKTDRRGNSNLDEAKEGDVDRAQTISSDPEWRYINVRRYFAYLGRSIDNGTQWGVFESNGEAHWSNVRETVENFMFNEWKSGALLGAKPEEAFFVRCYRTTITQNDIDLGRMNCLVGVAPLKPQLIVHYVVHA